MAQGCASEKDVGILENVARVVGQSGLLIALAMSFILFFVFRKGEEFDKHASQNTAATLLVYGLNIIAATLFFDDINRFAQRIYDKLHVPHLDPATWDNVPIVLTILIAIAAKDLIDYWNHRLMHTTWGWPTHAAHHSDTHVNAFTSYRVHFIEAVMMSVSYILLLTWLQMPEAIPFVVIFNSIHNKYVHMNLDWTHGPFRYLVASPAFHRWHHADVPEAYGKNLANVMPIYDLMFGTYYYPGPCREQMGALKTGVEDKNPIAIYTYPFREWARLIRERTGRTRQDTTPTPVNHNIPAE